MTFYTQEKSEIILVSISELFSEVEKVIFFDEFHFLLQNLGSILQRNNLPSLIMMQKKEKRFSTFVKRKG
jgi:hypothetical protein